MAESEGAQKELWTARFLDYLGLGCILTGVDILVRDSVYIGGVALIIIGGAILYAGLNWEKIKPRMSPRLYASIEAVSLDARWWIGILCIFVIAVAGPAIAHQVRQVPPSSRAVWLDRTITILITLCALELWRLAPYLWRLGISRSRYLTGNLGYLDHAVNSQRALKEYTSAMTAIGEITRRTGAGYTKRTAQLKKLLNRTPEVMTTQGHRAAKRQAKDMIAAATKIEPHLRILSESSRVFFDSQLANANLLDPAMPEQRVRLLGNIAAAETMKKTMEFSRDMVAQYNRQIQVFKSASQDLSAAVDVLSEKLLRVFAVMNDAVQFCDKVRDIQAAKIATVPVPLSNPS